MAPTLEPRRLLFTAVMVLAVTGRGLADVEVPASGFILGLGYGEWQTLPSEYLEALRSGYIQEASEAEIPRDTWRSLQATLGGYFSHGSDQLMVDLVFSSTRWGGSAGYRPTNVGGSVPVHRESSYLAVMGRYRRRVISRVFAHAGFGMMSDDNVVRADDPNIGGSLGQGDDPYPAWAWGADVELLRPPGTWLLGGFQVFEVLPKESHGRPDWQLITFQLTLLAQ